MKTLKVYIIEIGNQKLFTESKEEAQKVWEALDSTSVRQLYSEMSWQAGDSETFYYPSKEPIGLYSETIELYEDAKDAERNKANWEKAYRMRLIKRKKQKL